MARVWLHGQRDRCSGLIAAVGGTAVGRLKAPGMLTAVENGGAATVSPRASCGASRRRHAASFLRSTPRPMSSLRYRWKRSTGRGYQGLHGWLWCAHTVKKPVAPAWPGIVTPPDFRPGLFC